MNCRRVQVIGQVTKTPLRGMKLCIHKENGDHPSRVNVQIELFCSQRRVVIGVLGDDYEERCLSAASSGVITSSLCTLTRQSIKRPAL